MKFRTFLSLLIQNNRFQKFTLKYVFFLFLIEIKILSQYFQYFIEKQKIYLYSEKVAGF